MVYGNTAYFTERLNVNGSDITPDNIEQLKTVSNHVIQKLVLFASQSLPHLGLSFV